MMKTSPLSAPGISNSYSEHKQLINDDDASDSIESLFSDDTVLGLDNSTLDKTSVTGDHVQDHSNDDECLTFGDFQQDAHDVAPRHFLSKTHWISLLFEGKERYVILWCQ